jgi:ADP-ribosylglycohydrolase/catechol 2,3-dioxygenase-like lactoylglutathione lyase family enzyme
MMLASEDGRAYGALLGVAVGDALGWPIEDRGGRVGGTSRVSPQFEFEEWRRREGARYGPHEQIVRAGEVSDDTQLTLAVARSLLRGDAWYEHFTRVELPVWSVYERGGGGATKRAARTWLRGNAPWDTSERPENVKRYFGAGGNGTAMRCLPICVAARGDFATARRRLDFDALATHGHPRALIGSRVFGWAACWSLRRSGRLGYGELLERTIDAVEEWALSPSALPDGWAVSAEEHSHEHLDLWAEIVEETLELLHEGRLGIAHGALAVDAPVLDRIGVFGPGSGAGNVTASAAVFLASRYVTQPQQGLLTAAFARGADTDTLAAMTGGLLGCLGGEDWLWPLADKVQDADYVRRLTAQMMRGEHASVQPPFTSRDRTRLYRWLDRSSPGDSEVVEPFGRLEVGDIEDLATEPQFVRSWRLRSSDGQTFLIKRYDKGREGKPRWSAGPTDQQPGRPEREASTEPRAGLVLAVSDLRRAREFYEDVVGLPVKRTSDRYVSYGWLALEPAGDEAQLALGENHGEFVGAIRVYVVPEGLKRAARAVKKFGLTAKSVTRNGKPVLRTADPDGHVVEFWLHNGSVPPV